MASSLALATIAFNRPRLIQEQIRLLRTNLEDEFNLIVFDNSSDIEAVAEIQLQCALHDVQYRRLRTRMHHEGLNKAAYSIKQADYFGFLDHDVFPIRPTSLIPLIEEAGFYGIGQRHPATGHLYLWPGFCFFSREWLNGRPLDFSGFRDGDKRNDGDTGSGLWPLFEEEDWEKLYKMDHTYQPIRKPDGYGLQSWGYERLGPDWIHFSNGAHWMRVPDPEERDELLFALLK